MDKQPELQENKLTEEIKNPNDLEIGGLVVPESSRQPCEIWTRTCDGLSSPSIGMEQGQTRRV